MKRKLPVLAIVGPTATGKTSLGVSLALKYNGEIISCDSMQIYKGLPIGTAQPTAEEQAKIPHHLISFLEVTEPFSVSDYVRLAGETISELDSKGKLPVLVGGTGLYARSLLHGFPFEEKCRDDALRRELFLRAEQEGEAALHRELEQLDPVSAEAIHPHNLKRVIRALEYCKLRGEPFSAQAQRSKEVESPYRYLMICLSFHDRTLLYDRINQRVDDMMSSGLLREAESFYRLCNSLKTVPTAAQAIGYKELFPYFEGRVSLEEAVEAVKRESRRYAKRQITWFSRETGIQFLYIDDYKTHEERIAECVRLWTEFTRKEDARA